MDKHTNTIPTTCTTIIGTELANIEDVLTLKSLSGKGKYTRLCEQWLEQFLEGNSGRALVVSSCTSALEMAAILADIQPGDEVIVPSYTYVTTVNAFALRGAVPVFVDLEDATMNIDANLIEEAITPKTRAIIPVHYGRVSCDMDKIMEVAKWHKLFVCEDAAMACMSTYKGQMLGTIGNVGCLSFQEKKNFTAGGQGGALLINDPALVERAVILYDHGTNRSRFTRGEVDRYQWLNLGLIATLSELQAAFLYAQLQAADCINARRMHIWNRYFVSLLPLVHKGYITLPHVPDNTTHNTNRQDMIRHMASADVQVHPQFMPLHSSPFGRSYSRFHGDDRVTSLASSQILLLPVHLALSDETQEVVIRKVFVFWGEIAEGGI
ncbi:pyridoxal phosphate-dependent transferase [Aspergillus caelatus]|uniref:Pyridoxal phosphate-dependent transferase n=1 Tax=Aspergillus caelatus TaxID=61420 RepID=A0A5N7A684_9EURO|nr:pyridoxal phosphate-dependent transferase [Aspergillus caelatus]KAE8365225.1 pyridoxal phosphate-dependent transferase [Aspergillus caelatus]